MILDAFTIAGAISVLVMIGAMLWAGGCCRR